MAVPPPASPPPMTTMTTTCRQARQEGHRRGLSARFEQFTGSRATDRHRHDQEGDQPAEHADQAPPVFDRVASAATGVAFGRQGPGGGRTDLFWPILQHRPEVAT